MHLPIAATQLFNGRTLGKTNLFSDIRRAFAVNACELATTSF